MVHFSRFFIKDDKKKATVYRDKLYLVNVE